jgi:hypothetical protein
VRQDSFWGVSIEPMKDWKSDQKNRLLIPQKLAELVWPRGSYD